MGLFIKLLIIFFLQRYYYFDRKCGESPTENSCEWRTDTSPPYRNASKFALLLTGENEFGKNEQLFTIIPTTKPDGICFVRFTVK